MKGAKQKGVKEEKVFKEGRAIIRCEFWKEDPGSIWIVNLKGKRFVDKEPSQEDTVVIQARDALN